jgi:hypothetical protein
MKTRVSDFDTQGSDPTDPRGRFKEIRDDVEKAQTREDLTELYKRSVYMILLTHSSPLDEKVDRGLKRRRLTTEKEFARAVRTINRWAKKLGLEPDYDENWENIATNGYETEGENLLEAQRPIGIVREQEGQKGQ